MEETAKQAKFNRMTTEPVQKLVISLAIPTIISMLVTSLYNMADTYFVGWIGTAATAGVGLIFPIMTIIQAFGFFFGQGSGNFISRSLGAQNIEESETMATTGFFCALLFGGIFAGFGLLFKGSVLSVLGAAPTKVSAATIGYARDYLTLILIRRAVHVRLMCTQQPAPIPGQCRVFHDRPSAGSSSELRPGSAVYFYVPYGGKGRCLGHHY